MEENNKAEQIKEEEIKNEKIGFFKKVWYSITKLEKYPEMNAKPGM